MRGYTTYQYSAATPTGRIVAVSQIGRALEASAVHSPCAQGNTFLKDRVSADTTWLLEAPPIQVHCTHPFNRQAFP
jgi:hypothetical protein